jgi:hypothetical protein
MGITPIKKCNFRLDFLSKDKEKVFFNQLVEQPELLNTLVKDFHFYHTPAHFNGVNCDLEITFINPSDVEYAKDLRIFLEKPQNFNIIVYLLNTYGEDNLENKYRVDIDSLHSLEFAGSYSENDTLCCKVWLKGRYKGYRGSN